MHTEENTKRLPAYGKRLYRQLSGDLSKLRYGSADGTTVACWVLHGSDCWLVADLAGDRTPLLLLPYPESPEHFDWSVAVLCAPPVLLVECGVSASGEAEQLIAELLAVGVLRVVRIVGREATFWRKAA